MISIVFSMMIVCACLATTNADTVNVKGKLTCNGKSYETEGDRMFIKAFKKGSTGIRTSNPKFRTNGWADGLKTNSGPNKLDHQDYDKAFEINGIVVMDGFGTGNDGGFLSGERNAQLNTNAPPTFKIYNDCSSTKVCWMTDLPTSSINAETPFDLGTIELTKLPANFRVVNCWAAK